ncbi:uncharacterized protein LOC132383221 isoform X2 [Hypanus sabinus]|uniref:uncharacterized protein LOC132383221 isoform X2 n=1 Tax=Hypanus sabinus TaxID=79690 RepID=UPI0028C3BE0E|nr:uncharacterized protein LOC132383221 isoform X2 [Hypanus sabinus]
MELVDTVSFFWALSFCLPFWIIAFLCIRCRDGAPTRITAAFDDYIETKPGGQAPNHSSFTVIRQPKLETPVIPNLLVTPQPNSRRSSLLDMKESDSEMYPNYENTDPKESSDEEELKNDTNYIEVIPDDVPPLAVPVRSTQVSRNDRTSSGTIGEDYENLKDDGQDGSSNYVNVEPLDEEDNRQSVENDEDEDEELSDYVNSSKCALRQ